MKKLFVLMLLTATAVPCGFADASVTVKSVEAHQRYPWNGLVDIVVSIEGASNDVAEADCFFAATNTATQAALSVAHITRNGNDSGSGTTWARRFIWDAAADVGAIMIDDVSLTVDAQVLDYVQLWENGPYWAKCNVGASKPEEYGYYFQWDDTVGYKRNVSNNGWVSVKDGSSHSFYGCATSGMFNDQLLSAGYINATGNLVSAYDAATANLGAPWRMPTEVEFSALINNCDTTWTTLGGVYGRLVIGRGAYASKSIFLPAAGSGTGVTSLSNIGEYGHYWSSTPTSDYSHGARDLFFYPGGFRLSHSNRRDPQTIRPLRGFAK